MTVFISDGTYSRLLFLVDFTWHQVHGGSAVQLARYSTELYERLLTEHGLPLPVASKRLLRSCREDLSETFCDGYENFEQYRIDL